MAGADRMLSKATIKWLSILLIASLLFATFQITPAFAAGRQAVVVKVVGDVYIKKAGGSRELLAYEKMTLNDGDHIRTGKNSSVILQLADRDDEVTIDENSELYISDLREAEGKKSKFRVWSGTVLSKAKSMFGSNDEYEIDTPNAVMGVRGTNFLVYVDPITGDVRITVFSGIVEGISSHDDENIDIYPTFEGFVFGPFDGFAPPPGVSIIKPEELSTILNEEVLERLVSNKKEIDEENEEIANALQTTFSEMGYSEEDLDRFQKNVERIVTNVIKSAVETGRYSEEDLEEIIGELEDLLTIDEIINAPPVEPYDHSLSEEEQKRLKRLQEAQERREQQTQELENRRKQIQEERSNLLNQIRQSRERQQQENEQAKEAEAERAIKRYLDQLSDEEREKFEQRAQERQEERKRSEEERDKREEREAMRSEQQETSTPAGGSGGGGGSSRPSVTPRLGVPIAIGNMTDKKLQFADGIAIDFGNNDIPGNVTLTVTEASANDAESAGLEVAGSVLNFQFSNGYKPDQPVQLTLPINNGVDVNKAAIFHKEEDGIWMVEMTSTIENGVAIAWVNHFSTFGVFTAERTEQPLIIDDGGWNLVNAGQEIRFSPITPGSAVFYHEVNSTQRKAYDPANPPTATASGGFHANVYAVAPNRLPSEGQLVNFTAVTPTAKVVNGYGEVTMHFSKPVQLYDLDESNVFERRIMIDGQSYLFSLLEDFGNNEFISTYLGMVKYGNSEQEIVITLESGSNLTNPFFVQFDYIEPDTEERYHAAVTTPRFSTGMEPIPVSYAKFSHGSDVHAVIDESGLDVDLLIYDVPDVYGIQLHLLYEPFITAYDITANPDGIFGSNGEDPIYYGTELFGWTLSDEPMREYIYTFVNDANLATEIDIGPNGARVLNIHFEPIYEPIFEYSEDDIDPDGYIYGKIQLAKIIVIDREGNETTQIIDLPYIPIKVHYSDI